MNLYLGTQGGVGAVDKGHAHALAGRYGVVACGDVADDLAVGIDFVTAAGNSLVGQFDEPLCR